MHSVKRTRPRSAGSSPGSCEGIQHRDPERLRELYVEDIVSFAHDQVSVPLDISTGKALTDLQP
jgi:hypothetical protein